MGAYAFLIETGTEFQPPYQSALDEAALVWPGILAVLERPISVSGKVKDLETGAPLAARIELLNVPFSQGETNFSGGPRGGYHMFLPPGTYDIRFSAGGLYACCRERCHRAARLFPPQRDAELFHRRFRFEMSRAPAPVPDVVVFADDFETNRGWTTNPNGTDTATTGQWERGDPQSTSSSGTKQLGTTVSGINDLVTGRLAGAASGSFDVDSGPTSIQSPAIVLPSDGNLTLTFSYYLAHTLELFDRRLPARHDCRRHDGGGPAGARRSQRRRRGLGGGQRQPERVRRPDDTDPHRGGRRGSREHRGGGDRRCEDSCGNSRVRSWERGARLSCEIGSWR